ncbi:MAG: PLP-dependent aminotransferase family protein [Candidatus Eisenbacteria bacterium]
MDRGTPQARTLQIRIRRESETPLYRQIADSVRNTIENNSLEDGDRLPPMRELAARLGINRNTVSLAYRELERIGLVQSDVGRGTFVRRRRLPKSGIAGAPVEEGPIEWSRVVARRSVGRGEVLERLSVGDGVNRIELTGAVADRDLFPVDAFRDVLEEVVREMGPSVLDYGSREGYLPLRKWLAERLTGQGTSVSENDVFILNGAQPGLDLVAKLLIEEGDAVVVESPTYYNAIGAFRLYGAEMAGIPVDGEGIPPDALEEVLVRRPVKLLYCMPTFQNPTGASMGRARREAVLSLARRHGVAVLDDTFDADLRYRGKEETSLRGLPGGEDVLLLGTFSKILFPGLRLGWLVAPAALHEGIGRIRRSTDLAAGLLAQAAIHRFCEKGLLDRHIEKVRGVNRRRLRVLLDSMAEHFPPEAAWTEPEGGMSLWVTLPRRVDTVEVLLEARRLGVNFTPGPLFHADGGGGNAFRLSFTLEKEERIAEGIRVLGGILREKCAERRSAPDDAPSVFL